MSMYIENVKFDFIFHSLIFGSIVYDDDVYRYIG
jgi:hypothetical protein